MNTTGSITMDIENNINQKINSIKKLEKDMTNSIINKIVNNLEKDKEMKEKYNSSKTNLLEGFEGIRKDNSRLIFGILLSFIIIDLFYSIIYE